jgi:hypothetical protein
MVVILMAIAVSKHDQATGEITRINQQSVDEHFGVTAQIGDLVAMAAKTKGVAGSLASLSDTPDAQANGSRAEMDGFLKRIAAERWLGRSRPGWPAVTALSRTCSRKSAPLGAEGFVARTAILRHSAEGGLEAVEILDFAAAGSVGAELGDHGAPFPRLFPNCRQRRCIAAGLGTGGKLVGHATRRVLEGLENRSGLGEIEGVVAPHHAAAPADGGTIFLHPGLAGGDKIRLRDDGGRAHTGHDGG